MMLQRPQYNQRPIADNQRNEAIRPSFSQSKTCEMPWEPRKVLHEQCKPSLTIYQDACLEPTPIASNKILVVDKFGVEDSVLREEDTIKSFLRPLLDTEETNESMITRSGLYSELLEASSQLDETSVASLDSANDDSSLTRFRETHVEKWSQRFHDLVNFRQEFGHCLVPLEWPRNPSLAHWIKRQRCQYKAKMEGNHSTLTDERHQALEDLGFVWDSHKATWDERLNELMAFRESHGHCNVPSKYPLNTQLSIWVKCQRRQFKLFAEGKRSNMTTERISQLSNIGFVWCPRKKKTAQNLPMSRNVALPSINQSCMKYKPGYKL